MTINDNFIKALARANAHRSQAEFLCKGCNTVMPREEMATDPQSYGWCEECDWHEKQEKDDAHAEPRCPYCWDETCGGWCA